MKRHAMIDRRDRLDPTVARCRPAPGKCVRIGCARQAGEIRKGTPVQDFTLEALGGTLHCPWFIDPAGLKDAPARTVRPAIGTTV